MRASQQKLPNQSLEHTFKGISFAATDLHDFLFPKIHLTQHQLKPIVGLIGLESDQLFTTSALTEQQINTNNLLQSCTPSH